MEIGEAIAYYRKQKGLTQEQLAELAHTNNCYISRIENGNKTPSVPMLQSIAVALDIPLWMLFYGKTGIMAQDVLSLLENCTEQEQAELCANLNMMKAHMHRFR